MGASQLQMERRLIDPVVLLEGCMAHVEPRARQAGIILESDFPRMVCLGSPVMAAI